MEQGCYNGDAGGGTAAEPEQARNPDTNQNLIGGSSGCGTRGDATSKRKRSTERCIHQETPLREVRLHRRLRRISKARGRHIATTTSPRGMQATDVRRTGQDRGRTEMDGKGKYQHGRVPGGKIIEADAEKEEAEANDGQAGIEEAQKEAEAQPTTKI